MRKKASKGWLVFLCCLLAVPTLVYMPGSGLKADSPEHALLAGAVLGLIHVLLRPLLRAVTAPIGCLTLGLFGLALDVGLIYGCAYFARGFEVLSPVWALIAALFVNVMCVIVGGRR